MMRGTAATLALGLALALPAPTGAAPLEGEGWGKTRQDACRQALAALAETLQVEVKASFRMTQKSTRTDGGGRQVGTASSQDIRTDTDLPILGADQTAMRADGQFVCTARLAPRRARRYYRKRLADLQAKASDVAAQLERTRDDGSRHRLLTELLAVVDRHQRFALVAGLLGVEVTPATERSPSELRSALARLEQEAPSLAVAAGQLTRHLPDATIHLTPPHPAQSQEVTPFARALEAAMAERLRTSTAPEAAEFRLRGEYELTASGAMVTYRLIDTDRIVQEVRTATLAPEAFSHLRAEPQTMSFDRLLHQGLAVDSGFRATLATNRGREDLLFREGDEVELLIKLNQPGYYYLTGHTIRDGESYSYLLPLQDGRGDRRFVAFMNAEQVNKWVSLGAFEAAPPFGVESLQLIASTDDLVGDLPGYAYDRAKGLYLIDGDATSGVRKTRALKPKSTDKVRTAEAVLMFTTAPRP